jgi:hypothetical protein
MFIIAAVLFTAITAQAQYPKFENPPELKKLDWMVGEWKGEAVAYTPKGPERVLQHEVVQYELNGGILIVRGRGYARKEDGTRGDLVHDAFGVIGYDRFAKKFTFDPWVTGGMHAATTFEVLDNGFDWGFSTPGGKGRFKMRLNEAGEWYEVGEFSLDGTKWMKTVELTLKKVK